MEKPNYDVELHPSRIWNWLFVLSVLCFAYTPVTLPSPFLPSVGTLLLIVILYQWQNYSPELAFDNNGLYIGGGFFGREHHIGWDDIYEIVLQTKKQQKMNYSLMRMKYVFQGKPKFNGYDLKVVLKKRDSTPGRILCPSLSALSLTRFGEAVDGKYIVKRLLAPFYGKKILEVDIVSRYYPDSG